MRTSRQTTIGLLMLLGGTLLAAPASAIDLTGAWATDTAQCANVFKKKGKQLVFSQLSDLHGSGFVIEGSKIRGKSARCTIKSRTEDGTTLNLLAACATDIMLSSILVWQWSHDSAQAEPVTDTGRNRRGLDGTHSEVCQRLRPGA